jgi:hypothetical protein
MVSGILAVASIHAIAVVSGIGCVSSQSSADDFPALTGFLFYCLCEAVESALLCGIPVAAFTLSVAVVRAAFLLVKLVRPSPFLLLLYGLLSYWLTWCCLHPFCCC